MPSPSAKKLRILYLSSSAEISGAETSLLDLFSELDRPAFEPLVIVPHAGPLFRRLKDMGIDCRVLHLFQLKAARPWLYLKSVWKLLRLLIQEKVDLIHANMDICNQYAILPAKLLGIPIICHTRNLLTRRSFQRMFLPFSDVLIANSKATLKSYTGFWPSHQRRVVIYNSINKSRLLASQESPRARWGLPENAFVVVHIARLHPVKGQHLLLEALFDLIPRYPHLHALIAGDTKIDRSDAYRAHLQTRIQSRSLERHIILTGFVKEVGDLISAADALVLVSEEEGFGRVLVEAMMLKKPVISTRSGGPTEIIQDGETGILVDRRNPKTLSDALERLIKDPLYAAELAARGQAWAASYFSPANTYQALQEVYRETAARR